MQYDANGQMDYQVGYIWSDGKIVTQSLGLIIRGTAFGKPTETQINIDVKYLYEDGSNSPYAVMLNGGEYLFVRNAQGDVTAIIDGANGATLAEYSYDAWGQITATYSNDDDYFKAIMCLACPLTYRGYNYDFTTGLYYLQSRYYNPEWGRFLNVDDTTILVSSVGDPLAANMYAYCKNNPVNMVDYTGHWGKDVHSGNLEQKDVNRLKDQFITPQNNFAVAQLIYNDVYVGLVPYVIVSNNIVFYGTYYWALSCGYKVEYAKKIAYYCNEVDHIVGMRPQDKTGQMWHFNTFDKFIDSRAFLSICCIILAGDCFENGYVNEGLKYLGFALHPLQDYYSHTDDKVSYLSTLGLWWHGLDDTDSVRKRWSQLCKAREDTLVILQIFYEKFYYILGA